MAVLPIVHLLSLATLDALSRLPFLKVPMLPWFRAFCVRVRPDARSVECKQVLLRLGVFEVTAVPPLLPAGYCRRPSHTRFSCPPLRSYRLLRRPVCPHKIDERDRIAVMFCGSHKTLAFGIPLIKVRVAAVELDLQLHKVAHTYAKFPLHCRGSLVPLKERGCLSLFMPAGFLPPWKFRNTSGRYPGLPKRKLSSAPPQTRTSSIHATPR